MKNGDTPQRPLSTDKGKRDTRRRLELADRFNALHDKEWRAAFQELTMAMRMRDLECIYSLMRVIRVGDEPTTSSLFFNLLKFETIRNKLKTHLTLILHVSVIREGNAILRT